MNQEPLPQIHLIRDTDLSVFAYELHIFAGDFLRECEFNMRSLATNTGADSIAIMGKNHMWLSVALFAYCSTADLHQMILTTEFIGARAFLFHTDRSEGGHLYGDVLMMDLDTLRQDIKRNILYPCGVNIERKDGSAATVSLKEWTEMELYEKDALKSWGFSYAPNQVTEWQYHYSTMFRQWMDQAFRYMPQDLEERLNMQYMEAAQNPDMDKYRIPQGMGIDSLEAMRQGSIDGEQKAYEIVVAAAKQWEQQAAATQTINRALEYLRTPEIEHTGNQWKDTDNWRADQKISNRVYQMTCSIWEDTKYDRETKQSVPIAWYVTWEVRIHSPKQGYGAKIAGQNQKRYTDKNAAIKYLDGRKKAYSHLFTEISPPIPKEYEHHFMVHGTLLPGYTVEGLEQAKTEHAAAEVSEGGIFTPENQEKPSVLGKLSVAKTQEKTPTTPGTAMKKKEDIQL